MSSPGDVNRPGAPPVPGGMTNSGPLAASTIRARGATSEAISASPNCSSRPKTLRSTGWRHTSLRSPKYPLTQAALIRGSRAAAYSATAPPSPKPKIPTRSLCPWPRASRSSASTSASTFWTS